MTGRTRYGGWWPVILGVALLTMAAAGCGRVAYLGRLASGQLEMVSQRRPIDRMIDDPDTPEALKTRLLLVRRVVDFAERELKLPAGRNYTGYTHLDRPYAAWVVTVTPELSIRPETWCWPVVGCVAYRSYFDRDRAERFARGASEKGKDVYLRGAAAYSTLGWFQDPVLSTFVHRSETGLAGLIFHELAHKTLYVQDDTFFNEAFAMTVEQEGVRRWLVETGRPEAFGRYRLHRKRRREFIGLVVAARDQLAEVYQSPVEAAAKREAKARIIEELRARYQELKRSWDGYSGYDAWFASDINNAKLAGLAVYHRWVPAFQSLLAECGGDLEAFYQACQRLADLDPDQRRRRLERRLQADPAPAGVSVEGAGKATPQAKASSSW